MDLGITGRRALVCGASRGIGRGIGAALAAEGVAVALTSREEERAEAAAREIGATTGLAWDAEDPGSAGDLVARAAGALGGPLDIVVCNTGGPPSGPDALGFPREEWEAAYRALVLSPMALLEAVVPGMRERRWGRIIGVSSSSVREPIPYLMLSNAHRSATLAAFKTLAGQVASDGVTVNTLLTGRIATERLVGLHGSIEAAQEAAAAEVPAGRLGTVEEYGAVAAFLCGEAAAYVTGTAIPVDGGLLHSI